MLYSQMTAYAIEALAFFAGLDFGHQVKAVQISRILQIPYEFTGKVLTLLVRKKYLTSIKGPTGGFRLAVDPAKITLYRVIASLDGLTPLEENCVMGLQTCSRETPCALHSRWTAFKDQAIAEAQSTTLVDISIILLNKLQFRHNNRNMSMTDFVNETKSARVGRQS